MPCFLFMYINYSIWSDGYPLKLEDMKKTSGVITKVHHGKGKDKNDYIWVKDNKNNDIEYRLHSFYNDEESNEFKRKIQDTKTRVTIWHEDKERLFVDYKIIKQLMVDDKFITLGNKTNFVYNHEKKIKKYESSLQDLFWWLNKKELPIHRLNRLREYKRKK